MIYKQCRICSIKKSIKAFYAHPKTFDKHMSICRDCERKRSTLNYYKSKSNHIKLTNNWKANNINITADEYRTKFEQQSGRCAICKRHQTEISRDFAVDHDHKTGKIRGLLCGRCNGWILPIFEKYTHLIPDIQFYLQH